MSKIAIVGSKDGMGGLVLAFQCAQFIKNKNKGVKVYISASNEIFDALLYLFGDLFEIGQLPPDIDEKSLEFLELTKKHEEIYFICPDYTFSNKYAFDFGRYGIDIKTITQERVLNKSLITLPKVPRIYLALNSNTDGYSYSEIGSLAIDLAKEMPEYEIYLPILDKWAGKDIPSVTLDQEIPNNLKIDKNPKLIDSLEILAESIYCICADNGFSHLAYSMSIPRLLLDPRLRHPLNSWPWWIRWREDLSDSIDISTHYGIITQIVKTNLKIPQTQLLPKQCLLNNVNLEDWNKILLIKDFDDVNKIS
jgi:hypothetical protein